ncbi:MAG: glutathione S-transferase [Candidimonas sp.]|nr:MAG: glutathione S-transferase [Candidimonas sp.]TAM25266.1 MAG: glutathione S-transferase [Candidimonas sp.]TAM75792.1 MAG: glutathione S-transferase [Candidimonas sp.]
MKIYFSPASPFVRKCMIVAQELGLASQIEKLPSAASPVVRDQTVAAANPLGKVPTLFTDNGQALYDSRVICEYLNDLGKGNFFPKDAALKWQALTEQSLADGILDAALLARYENAMRPQELRWAAWTTGQMDKIKSGLGYFETVIDTRGKTFDIGTVALACALGYLDFRFPDYDWRSPYPTVAAWFAEISRRPSVADTLPSV